MNCFQLIDCNSGEVCEVGANAVAPSLREFLYPAVREGTGLYKGLFYRIACFDGRQGACFQVLWHGEDGEELLDCFVGWAPGQEMVRDKLRECCLVRALGIDWEALEPDDRVAAVLRYECDPAAAAVRDSEFPEWKRHLENLVLALSAILIDTRGLEHAG